MLRTSLLNADGTDCLWCVCKYTQNKRPGCPDLSLIGWKKLMGRLMKFVNLGREPMDMATPAAPSTTGQREKGEEGPWSCSPACSSAYTAWKLLGVPWAEPSFSSQAETSENQVYIYCVVYWVTVNTGCSTSEHIYSADEVIGWEKLRLCKFGWGCVERSGRSWRQNFWIFWILLSLAYEWKWFTCLHCSSHPISKDLWHSGISFSTCV